MSFLVNLMNTPWAIMPDKFAAIREFAAARIRDGHADAAAGDKPQQRTDKGYTLVDGVAVIPIDGVIAKRMNMFMRFSGGTSSELVARDLHQALADPAVASIVLHIDSPGGTVDGTADLAGAVFDARGRKPIVALSDGLMASAAYWIGSAADKVFTTGETTAVGSIGVVAAHLDVSGLENRLGLKTTEVYAGKYKRIASNYAPLTDEGRQTIQGQVDYLYSVFVGAIAKHRGASEDTVLKDMADGRVFIGSQAIRAGLVDGVASLAQLVGQYGTRAATTATSQARLNGQLTDFFSKHGHRNNSTEANPMTKQTETGVDEAALKRRWDSDVELRAEFLNDFKIFVAYEKANAKGIVTHSGRQVVQRGR